MSSGVTLKRTRSNSNSSNHELRAAHSLNSSRAAHSKRQQQTNASVLTRLLIQSRQHQKRRWIVGTLLLLLCCIVFALLFLSSSSSHQNSSVATTGVASRLTAAVSSAFASCPTHDADTSTKPVLHRAPATMSILITGGAGFIGSHMSLLLMEQQDTQYNIVVVDDLSRGSQLLLDRLSQFAKQYKRQFTFVHGCIGDAALMQQTMVEHRIDAVVHFAGFAYASESVAQPLMYFENTVAKTARLLSAMSAAGVSRLLYSSSSATYGQIDEQCDLPITEQTRQQPLSAYGDSKLQAEHVIQNFARAKRIEFEKFKSTTDLTSTPNSGGFSFALLRYFNVIGADPQARLGALPKSELKQYSRIVDACFDAAEQHKPMTVYGHSYSTPDGTAIRDYIHVSDLVRAHLLMLPALFDGAQLIYNVGLSAGASNQQVLAACRAVTGVDIPLEYADARVGDPAVVIGSARKLQSHFGWSPEHTDLQSSIGMAWAWRQAQHRTQQQHQHAGNAMRNVSVLSH